MASRAFNARIPGVVRFQASCSASDNIGSRIDSNAAKALAVDPSGIGTGPASISDFNAAAKVGFGLSISV